MHPLITLFLLKFYTTKIIKQAIISIRTNNRLGCPLITMRIKAPINCDLRIMPNSTRNLNTLCSQLSCSNPMCKLPTKAIRCWRLTPNNRRTFIITCPINHSHNILSSQGRSINPVFTVNNLAKRHPNLNVPTVSVRLAETQRET